MIIGGYALHLYCDNAESNDKNYHYQLASGTYLVADYEIPHTYAGNNFTECVNYARKDGWKVDRKNDICICPVCNGKMIK